MAAKVALFLFSVSGTFSTEFERKQSLSSRLAYESMFVCKEEVLGLKKFIGHIGILVDRNFQIFLITYAFKL